MEYTRHSSRFYPIIQSNLIFVGYLIQKRDKPNLMFAIISIDTAPSERAKGNDGDEFVSERISFIYI